ncbi:MAG: DUF1989 domain-containing protein [Rhizobiaceae bacterium]
MQNEDFFQIDACGGESIQLAAGSNLRVINTTGAQVVGIWAFVEPDLSEHMSMEHSRIHSPSFRPQIGTQFYTNRHRPILELTSDKSPGVHDWFLAACNQKRYELLGHDGAHANCSDNLHSALDEVGHSVAYEPCPLNLFESVSFMYGQPMDIKPPVAMPGDYVTLRTLIDCLVVLSACPQDILPTNGEDRTPRSVEIEISSNLTKYGL